LFFMGAPAYASESRGLTRGGAESIPEAAAASAEKPTVEGENALKGSAEFQVQTLGVLPGKILCNGFVRPTISPTEQQPSASAGSFAANASSICYNWTISTSDDWLRLSRPGVSGVHQTISDKA